MAAGDAVALATVIAVEGSAPLDPGATMFVDDAGAIVGSVTGGCVEGSVAAEAAEVLAGGAARVCEYGIADDELGAVGLMCGGSVRVFVRRAAGEDRRALDALAEALATGESVALATCVDGPAAGAAMVVTAGGRAGALGADGGLERAVEQDARAAAERGAALLRRYGPDGTVAATGRTVFIQAFAPRARLVIVGAIDHATALAELAVHLDFEVTVCEPRRAFAQPGRVGGAELVIAQPDAYLAEQRLGPRDAVVVLTHDAKFDEPALEAALASRAGYVGAMGSRRTHADRVRRLRERGLSATDISRIAAPCGLDIGARTPAEVAVSILAEIVARERGRAGGPLATTEGPIRPRPEVAAA